MKPPKRRDLPSRNRPATGKKPTAAKPATARRGQAVKVAAVLGRALHATPAPERVPAKWRWYHRALLSLQTRLLSDRGELRRVAAEPLEPHSLNEADSATDEFDHDLALTHLSVELDALNEVNEALKRIQNGSYGVCEESGKAIPAARLRAIPWARFTCEVEEQLEKQGAVRRMRVRGAATVRAGGEVRLAPEEGSKEAED